MVPHLWIIECHRNMFGSAENLTEVIRNNLKQYILPFKVTTNLKLSLFQFKIIRPLQPVHLQKSFQGQDY